MAVNVMSKEQQQRIFHKLRYISISRKKTLAWDFSGTEASRNKRFVPPESVTFHLSNELQYVSIAIIQNMLRLYKNQQQWPGLLALWPKASENSAAFKELKVGCISDSRPKNKKITFI